MLQRNLPMRQKQNHRHREQTGSCQRVGGWRKDRAEGWDTEKGKEQGIIKQSAVIFLLNIVRF